MLDELVARPAADGWTHTFIDGPPYEQDLIEMSVVVADVVLIPVKLAYFDASAIDSIIGMTQRRKKPCGFVIKEYDDRKTFINANNIALGMLDGRGPILKARVAYHPKHRVGQIQGETGAEIDKALAGEIDLLWTEAKKLAGVVPSLKGVEASRA